jgi:hypothetical protein
VIAADLVSSRKSSEFWISYLKLARSRGMRATDFSFRSVFKAQWVCISFLWTSNPKS